MDFHVIIILYKMYIKLLYCMELFIKMYKNKPLFVKSHLVSNAFDASSLKGLPCIIKKKKIAINAF